MKIIAIFLSFVSLTNAHARLVNPIPWNQNPSKTSPCGGGSLDASQIVRLVPGSQLTIIWQVIAADGGGTVTAGVDLTGGTNFALDTGLSGSAPLVGSYTFQLTVPSTNCTGSYCTLS